MERMREMTNSNISAGEAGAVCERDRGGVRDKRGLRWGRARVPRLLRRGAALALGVVVLAGFSGCALRGIKSRTAVVEISPGSLPAGYVQRMQEVVRNGRDEMEIEIGLVDAHDALVDAVGERLADSLTAVDPVFNNEMGLIMARRGEYEQAKGFLARGLEGLRGGEPLTGARVFDCRMFAPEERVYDDGEPDGPVDRDIWRAYRDHFFGDQITQREFVYRVLRRRGRFLPQPSLFPKSLAAVPIEVLNDHFFARRQTDLLSWHRFTHLPISPGAGTVREMEQALIMNRLVLGMLAGDRELVRLAAGELEKTLLLGGRLGDRQPQNLLQCAYFLLGDEEQLRRFKDPVLEAVLQ